MSNRWNYAVVEVKPDTWGRHKAERLQEELTRMGLQGWELVQALGQGGVGPIKLIFKKES